MENDVSKSNDQTLWNYSEIVELFKKELSNAFESVWVTGHFVYHKGTELVTALRDEQIISHRNAIILVLVLTILYNFVNVLLRSLETKRVEAQATVEVRNNVPKSQDENNLTINWSVFDLAKTAYEPGHAQAAINIIEKCHYDVNSVIPSNGLTLFLCACLSGQRSLLKYMLAKGADVTKRTKAGDSALYLATFGILSTSKPDITILEDLINSGCDVNAANLAGYTPLHRAASHGNLHVIQTLLKYGADPYQSSFTGIFPIDSAINAGNLDAADLLKINLPNPHVWDVVEPHTPPHIKLGLQSPQRKHLIESTRKLFSPRIM